MRKMKKIITLLALLLFAVSQSALAQKTITGKVINAEDGLGMPGVSIVVKGTTIGMSTTGNGNFVLNVPDDAIIVVSFMGFKTVEIPVGNQTRFDVILQPDARVLDDVVVTAVRAIPPERAVITAMGIVRDKNTLTTSIQSISGDELIRAGDLDPIAAMDGKIAGVSVSRSNSGAGPAEMLNIIIRGQKSFYGSNRPMIVLDGVPIINRIEVSGGIPVADFLSQLNPNDIESITVLKSANGAILYGSDGANGVIIITLKKQ